METGTGTDRIDTPDDQIAAIHAGLLAWYRTQRRDLPWRRTRDPYRILVSEVMLQQTQVDRVIPKYEEFVMRFPTLQALADAPTDEVIRLWSGLGYNRRAVNLQRAARAVVEHHDGVMPGSVQELRALPGIGPYTAGAVACFSFGQDVGFVDTNIRRVLHRVFAGPEVPSERLTQRQIQEMAERVVPEGDGYDWNQALMEFGAVQCTARKPACLTCPLREQCASFPEIQTVLATLAGAGRRRKREEPFGGSNRYYRGRVVETLRALPAGETLPLADLGRHLRDDYAPEHAEWLIGLVDGLRRDGLLEVAEDVAQYEPGGSTPRVRLPSSTNFPATSL